jgi:hypothetical protein
MVDVFHCFAHCEGVISWKYGQHAEKFRESGWLVTAKFSGPGLSPAEEAARRPFEVRATIGLPSGATGELAFSQG